MSTSSSSSSSSSSSGAEETKTNGANGNADAFSGGYGMFEAGIIEQVYVQDFMCHKKLTVDFGRYEDNTGMRVVSVRLLTCGVGTGMLTSSRERTARARVRSWPPSSCAWARRRSARAEAPTWRA
jgi:hypothetical protein